MKKLIILLITIGLVSCSEFLEIDPDSSNLSADLVFVNNATALAALDGIYHELELYGFASGDGTSLSFLGNTLSDDAKEFDPTTDKYNFYSNNIHGQNQTNYNIWLSLFAQLYRINALIEGVTDNENLSSEVKNQIQGEAKFLRSFMYYYLITLYGDVPLILTTDYTVNQSLPRISIEEVYVQIKQDLNEALELLPEDYSNSEGQRIRPNKFSVFTLMGRVALWQNEYDSAIIFANEVIGSNLYSLIPLDEVFKSNSIETIWSLVPENPTIGVKDSYSYILENNPATPFTSATSALTEDLLSIWEEGDLRATQWINVYSEGNNHYYYPFKYKIKSGGDTEEYSMVMRLAELYLIRAEAQAMLGNVDQALADLNIIRNRAGLPDWTLSDVTDIKQMVLEERRRELFSEWGHRWLDLKRFGKIDEILGEKKPQWSPHAKLLPIPEQDLLRNPFLTQNPGY